jgi:predicted nucleotidyltransferase
MSHSLTLEDRVAFADERLAKVRNDLHTLLGTIEPETADPELCIYVTGSLARGEASEHSDLDAFFLLSESQDKRPLSRIREVKILNAVVQSAADAGFPDFSNDGEYLRFLHIDDILKNIGSREDDYNNALTARMLLILESKYLYNEETFRKFRSIAVDAYFKDFHDHQKSFRPIFLLNDVLRFWRTMCINYENAREWRLQTAERSAKGHLANLKLRFSRLNICFSFIAHLLAKGGSLAPSDVLETCDLTPLQRLRDLRQCNPELDEEIENLLRKYTWFLDSVSKPKDIVLKWISDEPSRTNAFSEAEEFIESMYKVVHHVASKNGYLRFLII